MESLTAPLPPRPATVATACGLLGGSGIAKRLPSWRAYPEAAGGPAWSNGRTGQVPVSLVESVFREKYLTASAPVPLDSMEMHKMRMMLSVEASPDWATSTPRTPRQLPFHSREPAAVSCGCAKPSRPHRPVVTPQARYDVSPRPGTRQGAGRVSPSLQAAAIATMEPVAVRPTSHAATTGRPATRAASPSLPWLAKADEDHNLGGIHNDIIPVLLERFRQLSSRQGNDVCAWIIVESCRDCASHDSSLRHDEKAYMGRFQQLKEAVESRFGEGVCVELLVPLPHDISTSLNESTSMYASARRSQSQQSYRIGSFEVYLCCVEPMKLQGAAPLCRQHMRSGPTGRGVPYNAICLASKLRSRMWPSIDGIMSRLVSAMPRVETLISVYNELDYPLCGTKVQAFGEDDQPISMGETGADGIAAIAAPMLVPIKLRVYHEILMDLQEKDVEVVSMSTTFRFTAETVVQLWQMETAKELVVYCSSPTSSTGIAPFEGLVPFQGQVDCESGDALRPDMLGFIRSRPDPLSDAELVSCPGWRSCPLDDTIKTVHGSGSIVEIARLGVPIAEVSLVTHCCASAIPGAHIFVDDELFGLTDGSGMPLSCGLRTGEHMLRAVHHLLAPEGMEVPLNISGSTTCGVQVELDLDRLHFICVAKPGARSGGKAMADLWLVAGDLQTWRCSRGAPAVNAEVWLWDGELRSSNVHIGSPRPLRVQAGVLGRVSLSRAVASDRCEETIDDSDLMEASRRQISGGYCIFSDALSKPVSTHGPWRIVLHSAASPVPNECAVKRLTQLATGASPALWLARLASEDNSVPVNAESEPRLRVRSPCCSHGVAGVKVRLDNEDVGVTDEAGELLLGAAQGKCHIGLEGIPRCLLPGGVSEFTAHIGLTQHDQFELDVACLLWVYWVPPEEDETDRDFEDEEPLEEEGTVWVCANADQVPDEARPIAGLLRCPGAAECELRLDGYSMGPFLLTRTAICEGCCLLAQITFDAFPPQGFRYREKTPSPLAERCEELGGCELQRLMHCPVVVGYLPRLSL